MFVPSSAPLLIKIHVILCGPTNLHKLWCIHGQATHLYWTFVVESPLAYTSRLSIAPGLLYTQYNFYYHTLPGIYLSVWNLGTSPSLVHWIVQLNYTVELVSKFQGSYSYNAGDSEKKNCSSSICHLERFQLKILKSGFSCGKTNQQFIQMCATLHLGLVEKNNKERKSRVQTSKNLSDATVHPNYFKTREHKHYMNTLCQTDSRKHAKLKKVKVQLESDILWYHRYM